MSIVRDTDIVDPSLDRVAIDSTVSVKVHRKMYIGKVAAIGEPPHFFTQYSLTLTVQA